MGRHEGALGLLGIEVGGFCSEGEDLTVSEPGVGSKH